MKRRWSEGSAVRFLRDNGIEFMDKRIVAPEGFAGLTSCSAYDFLVNHCGYIKI